MTLNCKGTLIDLAVPKIMGILNVTPDSFYDGGRYSDNEGVLAQVTKMLDEGATFIDLGAYSSRPGAQAVSETEELQRILPIVRLLLDHFPKITLSIDTFRSSVAAECIAAGAAMINDISAGTRDTEMLATVARLRVPYIMMHMRGTAKTMQEQTDYSDLLTDILFYFSERIAAARTLGIHDIVVDPGFGFAKTLEQNYELLSHLDAFKALELPILVGLSRKSMIYKALGTTAENALNGSTVLHTYALQKGAQILRVHDVKEAMEAITLSQLLA